MRKQTALLLTVILALTWACGKSGNGDPAAKAAANGQTPATKSQPGNPAGKASPGAKGPGGEPQLEALPVNIETVSRQSLNAYLVLNGIVEPERKVEVFSRLSAYAKQIVQEEGAFVKQNDVLAILDDTEIRISHEQARIALEQAKLILDEAEKNQARTHGHI